MLWTVEAMIGFTEVKPTAANGVTEEFRCNACGATVSKAGQPQHRSWHEDIRQLARQMS